MSPRADCGPGRTARQLQWDRADPEGSPMTRARRAFGLASGFVLLVFVSSLTGRASSPQERPTTTRITAAANVTLRAQPLPTAPAVAQLPLGTEMTDAGPVGLDKTWVRVKLS